MSRRPQRGFTLLEVLVAIAILGLGMTVLLSSQVGLFTSAQSAEHLSQAENLLRCKMSEVELDLLKNGYQLTDQHEDGECCEEEESRGYHCSWKVERVELPSPPGLGGVDGGADLDPNAALGGSSDTTGLGAFGGLAALQMGGPSVAGDGGLSGLAGLLGGSAMSGTQGMAPLVMSMVYPDLKPMLEASIRKVTVDIEWKEGVKKRDLSVIQYVTNPTMGGLDPNAAAGLGQAADAILGTGTGTGTSSPTPTRGTR
jgi:general secretion pathway protein I